MAGDFWFERDLPLSHFGRLFPVTLIRELTFDKVNRCLLVS